MNKLVGVARQRKSPEVQQLYKEARLWIYWIVALDALLYSLFACSTVMLTLGMYPLLVQQLIYGSIAYLSLRLFFMERTIVTSIAMLAVRKSNVSAVATYGKSKKSLPPTKILSTSKPLN
jgi:hypothetical protein